MVRQSMGGSGGGGPEIYIVSKEFQPQFQLVIPDFSGSTDDIARVIAIRDDSVMPIPMPIADTMDFLFADFINAYGAHIEVGFNLERMDSSFCTASKEMVELRKENGALIIDTSAGEYEFREGTWKIEIYMKKE